MDSLPTTGDARTAVQFVRSFPKNRGLALVQHGTRCGRQNCRCARGQLHRTAYLRWREAGCQRRRYVRRGDLDAVRAAVAERRLARRYERMTWREAARLLERLEATYRMAREAGAGEMAW